MTNQPVLFVNANDPTDLAMILTRALFEFVDSHMAQEQKKSNFDNLINAIDEVLLSEEGKKHFEAGYVKYFTALEAANG